MEVDLTEEHLNFIRCLDDNTKRVMPHQESEYYTMIEKLKMEISILDNLNLAGESKYLETEEKRVNYESNLDSEIDYLEVIQRSIKAAEIKLCSMSEFSYYHGDFTPWNIIFQDNDIFVFDFEYACETYPKYLDIFHYFTQSKIFIEKKNPTDIYEDFLALFNLKTNISQDTVVKDSYSDNVKNKLAGMFKMKSDNSINLNAIDYYRFYLLSIIAFYIGRDKGNYSIDVHHNFHIWISILNILNQNNEL